MKAILKRLLAQSIGKKQTPQERKCQIISLAYGNCKISNPLITREMIEEAYKELHPDES